MAASDASTSRIGGLAKRRTPGLAVKAPAINAVRGAATTSDRPDRADQRLDAGIPVSTQACGAESVDQADRERHERGHERPDGVARNEPGEKSCDHVGERTDEDAGRPSDPLTYAQAESDTSDKTASNCHLHVVVHAGGGIRERHDDDCDRAGDLK